MVECLKNIQVNNIMEALNLFLLQCDKMKFGAIYQYGPFLKHDDGNEFNRSN